MAVVESIVVALMLCVCGSFVARADPPAGAAANSSTVDAPAAVPQASFFSSLKQAIRQDYDHEVVHGHFDVGSPPDVHRYYCMVDEKTGKPQPNAVAGTPYLRSDGMTGLKGPAVGFYTCESAERQGILVTAGYVSKAGADIAANPRAAVTPSPATPVAVAPPAVAAPAIAGAAAGANADAGANAAAGANLAAGSGAQIVEVAGLKLGMSPDEVRAILKSKRLPAYYELAGVVGAGGSVLAGGPMDSNRRFVNVVAAWVPAGAGNGNSYEVMFTPVPGRERAMAIVHTSAYSGADSVSEAALDRALVKKYGGYSTSDVLSPSLTWRVQGDGKVLVGDGCDRRGIFGGLGGLDAGSATRKNVALQTTPEELRYEIEQCGVAIVTEDHSTSTAGATRLIERFTVTAYSPLIALDGLNKSAQTATSVANAGARPESERDPRVRIPEL